MNDLRARLLDLTLEQRLVALVCLVRDVPEAVSRAFDEAEQWQEGQG